MLKLVKLYSNRADEFPMVQFRDGLNVVYASVTKNVHDKRSSHSLGKTLLAELIDFMLIKKVGNEFFLKSAKVFKDFVFYLEVQTSPNLFITICRPVSGKISLYTSKQATHILEDSSASPLEKNLGVDTARVKLDNLLSLSVVRSALGSFRKGLRYCIRRQEEFLNIFKAKNVSEKDKDWKPYLSGLLGINPDTVTSKYLTRETIGRLDSVIKELEAIDTPDQTANAIEAEINRTRKALNEMLSSLEKFSFQKIDRKITRELVEEVGAEIAQTNQSLYTIDQRLNDIEDSLASDFDYDIDQVKEIFASVSLHLPDQLIKTYDDLINLNKQMTRGRRQHLENAKEKLITKHIQLSEKRSALNNKQQELSNLLVEKEAFAKYKSLQAKAAKEESRLAVLTERLEKIDSSTELKQRLAASRQEEEVLTKKLLEDARQSKNKCIENVNGIFGELVKETLGIDANFYLTLNKEGNPHFQTGISDSTSVDKGHSFGKVMAACFDVALLTHYSDSQYYRFCYHDGLLESLDDRVKLRLIDSWRTVSSQNDLQLIFTVLDTDVPEDDEGSKIYFRSEEIIRELHDRGREGRLFRIPKF